jgi:hypothetical protein
MSLRAVRTRFFAWLAGRFIRIAELLLGRYSKRYTQVGLELMKRGRPYMAREFVATSMLLVPGNAVTAAACRDLIAEGAGQPPPVTDEDLGSLEAFCCFVGYPRSGHSLPGSLLDAHPNATISHELNATKFVCAGWSREDLFRVIIENTRLFARSGRQWTGYSYQVPGQWQGRFEDLRIIGDKKGGGTAAGLVKNPALLDELSDCVKLPLRVVHVHRNPYDNIAAMAKGITRLRSNTVDGMIETYFRLVSEIERLKRRGVNGDIIDIPLEDLIAEPRETLARICRFLGLRPDAKYLSDCAGIVFESPKKSRRKLQWSDSQKRAVQERAGEYDWLRHYDFTD